MRTPSLELVAIASREGFDACIPGASLRKCKDDHPPRAAAPDGTEPYFFRTAAGAEIDLLLMLSGGRLWAIEIKRSLAPKVERGFHEACAMLEPERRFVLYPGLDRFALSRETEAVPLRALAHDLEALR